MKKFVAILLVISILASDLPFMRPVSEGGNPMKKTINAARRAAADIKNSEDARRRHDNPGDGSAFESTAVMNGEIIDDTMVKRTMAIVDALERSILERSAELKLLEQRFDKTRLMAGTAKAEADAKAAELRRKESSSIWRAMNAKHLELEAQIRDTRLDMVDLEAKLKENRANLRGMASFLRRVERGNDAALAGIVWAWRLNKNLREKAEKELADPRPIRRAEKVAEKEHVKSFSVLTFNPHSVNTLWIDLLPEFGTWKPYTGEDLEKQAANDAALLEARAAASEFLNRIRGAAGMPVELNSVDGSIIRLPESNLTRAIGIDPDDGLIKKELMVVDHKFETLLEGAHWKVFGTSREDAEKLRMDIIHALYRRLIATKVTVDGVLYRFCGASASHQKEEKAVFIRDDLANLHAEYLYFGKTLEELANDPLTGAQFLKAMANRMRPIADYIRTKDGTPVTVFDILCVPDAKRVYHHDNALNIGGTYKKGRPYEYGKVDNPVVVGAGQIAALKPLELYGQLSGEGWKGFVHGADSVIRYAAKKNGLTVEEFLNRKVRCFNGEEAAVEDYTLICSEDCFKFDKLFKSFSDYLAWVKRLMLKYPGIENLTLLRQMDDEEGKEQRRTLSRSLLQQFVWADYHETFSLAKRSIRRLNNMKMMSTALRSMAGFGKIEEERNDLQKLLEAFPNLLVSPAVQQYMANRFDRIKAEAMANRLDEANGSYPYIIQDPVAVLEIWILGMNQNREDLGVLRGDEASIEGVFDSTEVLGVRFPANFFTVKKLTVKTYADIFASCGNACILSIYSDILIRQDGDTDGDEMKIITDQAVIRLYGRMLEAVNPPVIVFDHGSKKKAVAPGSVRAFWKCIADALWSAHHNGQVGKWANLARDCMYLLSQAYMQGDDAAVETFKLWAAAASTGAILAIDQVKGNDISEKLISWLEAIKAAVSKMMGFKQPYTQQFLKGIDTEKCLPANDLVITDRIAIEVNHRVGEWSFDAQGYEWNPEQVKADLLMLEENGFGRTYAVRTNVLNDRMVKTIRSLHYNDQLDEAGRDLDVAFLNRVKNGQEVGLKEIIVFYWHNEMALKRRLDGRMQEEAVKDFYTHVRETLREFALTNRKPNGDGTVRRPIDELTSLYNRLVDEALELTRTNGIDEERKGSYAMFILRVIAPWMRVVLQKNGIRNSVELIIPDAEETDWNDVPEEEEFCEELLPENLCFSDEECEAE